MGADFKKDGALISIYANSNGSRGLLLQTLVVPTECEVGDLVLNDNYGALLLGGFTNRELGSLQIFYELIFQYQVTNVGTLDAVVTSAIVDSPFDSQGPTEVLPGGAVLEPRVSTTVFQESQIINLEDKESSSTSFQFSISADGNNPQNTGGATCPVSGSLLF